MRAPPEERHCTAITPPQHVYLPQSTASSGSRKRAYRLSRLPRHCGGPRRAEESSPNPRGQDYSVPIQPRRHHEWGVRRCCMVPGVLATLRDRPQSHAAAHAFGSPENLNIPSEETAANMFDVMQKKDFSRA
ncbi:hypothetical protein HD806DRAFT_510015 [Xylariaceae sp. AK1471]|nr:hypothetical protein HD806DRAFT_510015 [Xylariaceae sp. AK1471]